MLETNRMMQISESDFFVDHNRALNELVSFLEEQHYKAREIIIELNSLSGNCRRRRKETLEIKKKRIDLARRTSNLERTYKRRAIELPKLMTQCQESIEKLAKQLTIANNSVYVDATKCTQVLIDQLLRFNLLGDATITLDLSVFIKRDHIDEYMTPSIELLGQLVTLSTKFMIESLTKSTVKPEIEVLTQYCFKEIETLIRTTENLKLLNLYRIHNMETYLMNSNLPQYKVIRITNPVVESRISNEVRVLRQQVTTLDRILNELVRTNYWLAKFSKERNLQSVLSNSSTLAFLEYINEGNPEEHAALETQLCKVLNSVENSVIQIHEYLIELERTYLDERVDVNPQVLVLDNERCEAGREIIQKALANALEAEKELQASLNKLNLPAYLDCLDQVDLWQRRVLIARKLGDELLEEQAKVRLERRQEELKFFEMYISEEKALDPSELPNVVQKALPTIERIETKCGLSVHKVLRKGKIMLLLTFVDRVIFLLESLHQFAADTAPNQVPK